ncbi:recombination regulator RecX [Comamonas composti]|uniref:recombination regulator RecX n=1 Tax=Comamonas composti TaxID=408558 RepID=UPI0003FDF3C6|nr:recombination regulator RecX [Comamonas composti]
MGFAKLSLKGRALKLLAQREHSRRELERKLAPHVQEGEDLAAVLDALEQRGFISEQRVAESIVHSKAARFGTARLTQELRNKGLDDELVRATAEQLRATELERAHAVWRQRFGTLPGDAKEKARQLRFMASRGFALSDASRILREAMDAASDDSVDPI